MLLLVRAAEKDKRQMFQKLKNEVITIGVTESSMYIILLQYVPWCYGAGIINIT